MRDNRLHLRVTVQRFKPLFAAVPRMLIAAERNLHTGTDEPVDLHLTSANQLGEPCGDADVLREHRRSKAIVGVIRDGDGFGLSVESDHTLHGAEYLSAGDLRSGRDSKNGGLRKAAGTESTCDGRFGGASEQLGTVVKRSLNESQHTIALLRVHERTDIGAVNAGPDAEPGDALEEQPRELGLDVTMHDESGESRARLPRIPDHSISSDTRRSVQIGVWEDDGRRLAAQLQIGRHDVLGRRSCNRSAGPHRTGEREVIDAGMCRESGTGYGAITWHEAEDTRRKRVAQQLRKEQGGERREFGGLHYDGISDGERGRDPARELADRRVPRGDMSHNAIWLPCRHHLHRGPGGNDVAEELLGCFRVEAEVLLTSRHVAARLCDWLASVERLDGRELIGVLEDDVGDAVHQCGACGESQLPPVGERIAGRGNSSIYGCGARVGHHCERVTRRRVEHLALRPSCGQPRTTDQAAAGQNCLPRNGYILVYTLHTRDYSHASRPRATAAQNCQGRRNMTGPIRTPIGIVGLGNMGLAIAERLAAEFEVLGTDLSEDRRRAANESGIAVANDLAEISERCEIVVMSLPHPAASLSVARTIAAQPCAITTVLETSTVTPSDVLACKRELEPAGIALLDAAILSGVAQMRGGTAGIVLAGDHERIAELGAIFDALTANQTVLGGSGTAMAAKVINNAVAHVVMVLLSESLALSNAAGLDPQAIIDILAAPDGGLMRPLTHRIAERVLEGDYEGGMSLEAARKDSTLALQMATDAGIPTFTIPAAHAVYEMAMSRGWEREDYAALAKLWEDWCGESFARGH